MIGFAKRLAAETRDKGPRLLGTPRMVFRRWRRNPRKILLLKTWNDHLGDLILISGTLRHYRRLYVDCRLELACPDSYAGYFQHCPHLDAVVPLSCFGTTMEKYVKGAPTWSPWNSGRYDRVISLRRTPLEMDYGLIQSLRPAWTAGMTGDHLSLRAAEASKHEALLNCAAAVPWQDPPVHEFEIQLNLLKALGAEVRGPDDIWPECWTTAEDVAQAKTWLTGLAPGIPVLVWAPCGSWPIRDWNAEGYRQVFAALPECALVMVGTGRDAQFTAGMDWSGMSHIRRIDLVGKTSSNELAEVVRKADLVLSAETAVFHLAAMLRRPAICLAGGGHWGRFVPWGLPGRTRVLTRPLECFGCGWICRRPTVECIQGIGPGEVIRHAEELLRGQDGDE